MRMPKYRIEKEIVEDSRRYEKPGLNSEIANDPKTEKALKTAVLFWSTYIGWNDIFGNCWESEIGDETSFELLVVSIWLDQSFSAHGGYATPLLFAWSDGKD